MGLLGCLIGSKVFTNGFDWFVADSLSDLRRLWAAHLDVDPSRFDPSRWRRVPNAQGLTIWCNAAGRPDLPHSTRNARKTKTAREWAKSQPRGFLFSSEV